MEQPLAQRVARRHRLDIRPQQFGKLRTWCRTFEREPRQQAASRGASALLEHRRAWRQREVASSMRMATWARLVVAQTAL